MLNNAEKSQSVSREFWVNIITQSLFHYGRSEEIIYTRRPDIVQTLISLLAIQQAGVGEMEFVVVSYFITFLCTIQYSGESLSKSIFTYVYFTVW